MFLALVIVYLSFLWFFPLLNFYMIADKQRQLLIVKFQEFEPLIQKPYSIVYFHSAASLQL